MGLYLLQTVCVIFILTKLPLSSAERVSRQISCRHPLRHSFPKFFTHCDSICLYSSWSSWKTVSNSVASVPVSKCPSGKAYTEGSTRISIGSNCTEPLFRKQIICLPTQEERLIIALGLGSSGHDYRPIRPLKEAFVPQSIQTLPGSGDLKNGKPCINYDKIVCNPGVGKRSVENGYDDIIHHDTPLPAKKTVLPSNINPIPFDWLEHGPRLRSKRQTKCGDQSTQHVLFVLDTSGSVGEDQFNKMTSALSLLPSMFCNQVQFAVVTFSSYVNLEFCFDCFDNTYSGRADVSNAIQDLVYRGGGTNTGATAKCVCDQIIQHACGIDKYPDCLDVVFITDGKSNDPDLKICDTVKCLHSQLGIDTYAIGINSGNGFTPSYNPAELSCITNFSDLTSVFEFDSFEDFEDAIKGLSEKLLKALRNNSPQSCARLNGSIATTGATLLDD